MKVFLCWSGKRSKKTAEVLSEWLPLVINAVEPWMSPDMEKGIRWGPEIADKLEESKVGIICLTRENLDSRWILFEAGALSKTKDAHVCTFLLDLKPIDIKEPLAQFQATQFQKEDFQKLVGTINEAVRRAEECSLAEKILSKAFCTNWPALEIEIQEIVEQQPKANQPVRTIQEMVEEILELVRVQGRMMKRTISSEWLLSPYWSPKSKKELETLNFLRSIIEREPTAESWLEAREKLLKDIWETYAELRRKTNDTTPEKGDSEN